jgi:signal peptidase II
MVAPTRSSATTVLVVASMSVLADWATKAFATIGLDEGPTEIGEIITLRLSHNSGVAFGMGDALPGPLIIVFTAAVTGALTIAALRGTFGSGIAAGLILGGAVANLGDRMIAGSVVDFLDVGWWPSFNLADVFLCVGCALLVVTALRQPEPRPA